MPRPRELDGYEEELYDDLRLTIYFNWMAMQSIKEKGDSVDPRMENLMNEIYYKAYPERKPCVNTKTSSGDDSDSAAGSGSDSDSDEGKQHSDKESDEERTMSATLGTESTEVPSASTPKDQHTTYGEEEEEKKVAPSNDEQGTWSGSMKEAATLGTDSIEVPSATTPIDKDTTPDCEEKYAPSNYVIEPSQYKMWALGDLNKKVDELQVEKCLQNPTPPELKAIQQEAAKAVMGEINGAINNLQENQKMLSYHLKIYYMKYMFKNIQVVVWRASLSCLRRKLWRSALQTICYLYQNQ